MLRSPKAVKITIPKKPAIIHRAKPSGVFQMGSHMLWFTAILEKSCKAAT